MNYQMDMFDHMYDDFKFNKEEITLFESFAGIGSQAVALKTLSKKHRFKLKTIGISEIDKYAIASYNAIHGETKNFGSITDIQEIPQVDIFTYSFPCQDISLAGNQKGFSKDSGTRSGLLWEVERILENQHEINKLPKVLLMENVKALASQKFVKDFNKWQLKLQELGYTNYWEILNAKDYGIPQNRARVFMISILGKYNYNFPPREKLKLRLKDMLEDNVDEKYYLSAKQIKQIKSWNAQQKPLKQMELTMKREYTPTLTARGQEDMHSGLILIKEATKKGYAEATDGDGVYINRPHQKRGVVQKDMIQTIKTSPDVGVVVKGNYSKSGHNASKVVDANGISPIVMGNHGTVTGVILKDKQKETVSIDKENLSIRKLTPKECWRLMGFDDESFSKVEKVCSNTQLYKQAGNSIVVNVLERIFDQLF